MSADFGGAVRVGVGAGVARDGTGDGESVTLGTTIVDRGAIQLSGCTTVTPVAMSWLMIRTCDSAAHDASVSGSLGPSVTW